MAIFYPSHVTDFHGSEGERLVYEALHRLSNDYVVFYSFRWLGGERESDFPHFLFYEKQNPICCPCALLQLRYKLLIS